MELAGAHAVVTGGASGLGRALCRLFAAEGARVVVADLDGEGAARVARELGGLGVAADVGREKEVRGLVDAACAAHGPIDLFLSNAGIGRPSDVFSPDAEWQEEWQVHVMSHVYAARAVLPALTYHERGIRVSCVCPLGMRTAMTAGGDGLDPVRKFGDGTLIEPEQAARRIAAGIRAERFLILTHPEVHTYFQRKASDHDRWLAGMRRLYARLAEPAAPGAGS